jgi:hypothetical protein
MKAQFTRLEKLLPGGKAANPKVTRPQESLECFPERRIIVDDGGDGNVTHRTILRHFAILFPFAVASRLLAAAQATYGGVP